MTIQCLGRILTHSHCEVVIITSLVGIFTFIKKETIFKIESISAINKKFASLYNRSLCSRIVVNFFGLSVCNLSDLITISYR